MFIDKKQLRNNNIRKVSNSMHAHFIKWFDLLNMPILMCFIKSNKNKAYFFYKFYFFSSQYINFSVASFIIV